MTVFNPQDLSPYAKHLTTVAVKTSNYSANTYELIPVNLAGGSFTITLPTAPADETVIEVLIVQVGTTGICKIQCGGTDVFTNVGGSNVSYMSVFQESKVLQYKTGVWHVISSANPSNFANNFTGIDAATPITNANISIDYTTRILTIIPPLGYFNIVVDGNGRSTRYRKEGNIPFPAFTDTSGTWYFYFNVSGTAVTTQTPWLTSDFATTVPVYRLLYNKSLATPTAKVVSEYVEYHVNDIPSDSHAYMHLNTGTIWGGESLTNFALASNVLPAGDPAVNGSNSVVGLTTGSNIDDNLEYTITNSTAGTPWTQDMGTTIPASLNATNSGLFQVFSQSAVPEVSFLPATRFPFPFNVTSNTIEFINATGTRAIVGNTNYVCVFIYATQNPRVGEAVKVVTSTTDFTSITNARAYTWSDIQTAYPLFGLDQEIRPLHRLIFESKFAYDTGAKKAALREFADIRKSLVTSATVASGSLPASSVTFVPYSGIASTNVQSAISEVADERVIKAGDTMTGGLILPSITIGTNTISDFGDLKAIEEIAGTSGLLRKTAANTWDLVADYNTSTFGITVDGGGSVLTTGSKGYIVVPFGCTIVKWFLVGDQAGSVVMDLHRGGTSIIGAGNHPTTTSAQRANATASSWTDLTLDAEDEIEFQIDSVSNFLRLTLVVKVTKL